VIDKLDCNLTLSDIAIVDYSQPDYTLLEIGQNTSNDILSNFSEFEETLLKSFSLSQLGHRMHSREDSICVKLVDTIDLE